MILIRGKRLEDREFEQLSRAYRALVYENTKRIVTIKIDFIANISEK
jgi:hypothetical protein